MPRGFNEREKQVIRARLVKQGGRLFASHGLKKTSVEELARAAGISKGAFYIFYPSKESLFMDVVEEVERDYRNQILASVDRPGRTPRRRLRAILEHAFTLWRQYPALRVLTGSDVEVMFRSVPPEQVDQHFASDQKFIADLVSRCREAGMPLQASTDKIAALFYAIVLMTLHEDDFGPERFAGTVNLLIELTAAYFLGEVSEETYSDEPLH